MKRDNSDYNKKNIALDSNICKRTISIKVFLISFSIVFSIINKYKYGGGLSSIFIFIIGSIFIIAINKTKLKFNINTFYLIIFWIVMTISTATSPYTYVKQDTISFLIFVLYISIVASINYLPFEIKFLINAYITTAIIASINILYNVIIDNQATWNRYSTSFFGVNKDPNYASASIVPAIMILLFRILYTNSKKKKSKLLSLVALLIITMGAISTGSRSSFLFVVFSYIYNLQLIILKKGKQKIKMIITTIIILIIIALSFNYIIDFLPSSLTQRLTQLSSYTNDSIRFNIWKTGIKTFFDYPIVGVGLNGANDYLSSIGYHNTHNIYLDILTGSGILGSVIFILLLISILRVRRQNLKFMIGLVMVMLGPLFFINGFNTPNFWTPIMLLLIINKHSYYKEAPLPNWI